MKRSITVQPVVPPGNAVPFRADGAYIVTGGMGGLGLFLAEQMAAAGGGRIVLNGRSEPTAEALEVIERIRKAGTEVEIELTTDDSLPDTTLRPRGPASA